MLMAAIPPRPKTYLVVRHELMSILPAVNRYLIPVYKSYQTEKRAFGHWQRRLFKKIHNFHDYSKKIAHQKNIRNIAVAAKMIEDDSLVAIFPNGGAKNGKPFHSGVGYIIKNLKQPNKTKLVMAYVEGTSILDFFRIIPLVKNILPNFRINFSRPVNIIKLSQGEGPDITRKLQQVYENWSRPLKPLPKHQGALLYLRSILMFLLIHH